MKYGKTVFVKYKGYNFHKEFFMAKNIKLTFAFFTILEICSVTQSRAQFVAGGNGRGPAANQLNVVGGIVMDKENNIYVVDIGNSRVQKWAPGAASGITVAGGNGNGSAQNQFKSPQGITIDDVGNLYIADTQNNRIQKWIPGATEGITVAGGIQYGSTSDKFSNPKDIKIDKQGNLYVADMGNCRIQKWAPGATNGVTVAGGNGYGSAANQLANPYGIFLDKDNTIYIADALNNRIQKWVSGASSGITVAGGNGSGNALNQLYSPSSVSVDKQGNIFVADGNNNRIVKWPPNSLSGVLIMSNIYYHVYLDQCENLYTVNSQFDGIMKSGNQICNSLIAAVPINVSPTSTQNRIIEWTPTTVIKQVQDLPAKFTNEVMAKVDYFDGLGRPIQSVQVKGNNNATKDIVTQKIYDATGKETLAYLPFASSSNDGSYKASSLSEQIAYFSNPPTGVSRNTNPYAETEFEPTPLNRFIKQGGEGLAWQISSGHAKQFDYSSNATGEVRFWKLRSTGAYSDTYYAPGTLFKKVLTDEDGRPYTEFKDLQDRLVLTRRYDPYMGNGDTQYIYDDFGNLFYVIPTKYNNASFDITQPDFGEFIYEYLYDDKNRILRKQIPGKGWESYVYNSINQVVATQDAMQALNNKYTFTKYDGLGRVIQTGEVTDPRSAETITGDIAAQPDNWEVRDNSTEGYSQASWPKTWNKLYTENYYDNYTFPGRPYASTATGVSSRAKELLTGSKALNLTAGTMLWSVYFYDEEGRLREKVVQNHLNGADRYINDYNFNGLLTKTTRTHGSSTISGLVLINESVYDHLNRKKQSWSQIGGGAPVLLSQLDYNDVGQLWHKYLHSKMLSINYEYNERNWRKNISSTFYTESLHYDNLTYGTNPQFSGNLAEVVNTFSGGSEKYVTYKYDSMNRMTEGVSSNQNSERNLFYDMNGNITHINRQRLGELYLSYSGNKLKTVSGYLNGTLTYDANGNLFTDGTRGITSITYNYLNLPQSISGPTNINYTYDATGKKLRAQNVTMNTTTDYIDGIHFVDFNLAFIQTEEGRAIKSGSTYNYEYTLTDHLGNNRVTFDTGSGYPVKRGEQDYYPLGLNVPILVNDGSKYLYNSKELQDGINMYDYGARFYDPVLGRFTTIDPLAEKHQNFTPYNYTLNNPVNYTDPMGLDTIGFNSLAAAKAGDQIEVAKGTYVTVAMGDISVEAKKQEDTEWAHTSNNLIGSFGIGWGAKENLLDLAAKASPEITELKYFKAVKIGSKGLLAAQAVVSGAQALNAWSHSDKNWRTNDGNKWGVTSKAALDITMGAIGTFGGPIGWGVSGTYFVGDYFGVWGNWGEAPKY